LYLVATPIGNLADLSPRALEILARVPVAYAEDTRRTLKLVRHFDLHTRLVSLHAHNERERVDEVLAALEGGEDRALVTDAGTPSVSDPGAALVRAVADAGLPVVPIPGPSAVLAALAASGFGADEFAFLGFPPRGGTRREAWVRKCAALDMTVVAFESPKRLGRLLVDLAGAGLAETSGCVCRELTKLHEEVRRGTVARLADYYGEAEVRGEVTVVIDRERPEAGGTDAARRAGDLEGEADEGEMLADARWMAGEGASTREIAAALKRDYGLPRNAAYTIALIAGAEGGGGERAEGGAHEGVDEDGEPI
jgi:16S rRNA (cytidine1402-2'-O)-methyltransferase